MPPRLMRLCLPGNWLPAFPGPRFSTTAHRAQKTSDPLRILFCGSDEFSIAALRALHEEHKANDGLIQSLDVVVRPGKPTGRGMKTIREVPIKSTAQELGLRIHELNTFTGWAPFWDVNLIIAVSFGLMVPPRLLRLAKYGGLNLHPSLLPDLRGPAPLHHTLLQNRSHTGITLQTLHEAKFDHGTILAQTPLPGIAVPPDADLRRLHQLVTPAAAEMLVRGLREGVHVPPHEAVAPNEDVPGLSHAPKLVKKDRQVRWESWSAEEFVRHQRVLGPLWTEVMRGTERKRVILEDGEVVDGVEGQQRGIRCSTIEKGEDSRGGETVMSFVDTGRSSGGDGSGGVVISMAGGSFLKVREMKVEGEKKKPAGAVLAAWGS
ncbi:methionyl-tRNA transformylase [Plectosphaerella cucumerina]|uniref:methionyl-tRNA formyltransferase n=1 Tax=Plectosphaerella cucumerina TaxID=40658 RepID=A0A8K0TDG5_9PEZI|nr:methionyl-tRNA transformylase [Plectosphaerella cucumerina]